MTELTYEQLTDDQRGIVDKNPLTETETSLYVVTEKGLVIGYRMAEMFMSGKPYKWGAAMDIKTDKALVTSKPLPAVVRASDLVTAGNGTNGSEERYPRVVGSLSVLVKRVKLFPCPINPRKEFDPDYLQQLAVTLKNQGVLNDLIGRPRPGGAADEVEIVAGECRWRSSEIAGIEELPVKIRNLSDSEVLELMLVENMRRKDLTVFEEADAFVFALAQRSTDGELLYGTIGAFAAKIGETIDYVKYRLPLRKLPSLARNAMLSGDITARVAQVICSYPEAVITKLVEVVLRPAKFNVWTNGEIRPLDEKETARYANECLARELRDTPFSQKDEKLFPIETSPAGERIKGGACFDCPHNSANHSPMNEPLAKRIGMRWGKGSEAAKQAGRLARVKWCHNPECFSKKLEIHTAAELVRAKEKGCRILSEEEASKILYDDGAVKETAGYVRLDEKPEEGERNKEIETKKVPTWGGIVRGETTSKVVTGHDAEGNAERSEMSGEVDVPVVVAVTKKGHVVELVERKTAVTAAQKLGTAHYLNLASGGGRSLVNDEAAEREKKIRAEQKVRNEVSFAAMGALVTKIEDEEDMHPMAVYGWLAKVAMWHGGNDAHSFVVKRRGLPGVNASKELADLAKGAPFGQLIALAFELLLARPVKFSGVSEPFFQELAGIYKVNVGAIEKEIREKAEGKAPKKKKADQEEHPIPNTQHPTSNGEGRRKPRAKHPAKSVIAAVKGEGGN